jgi:hypothetical protein
MAKAIAGTGSGFVWIRPPSELAKAIAEYGERVKRAVFAVAEYMAQKILDYAKTNRKWTDRTANARNALHAIAVFGQTGEQTRIMGSVPPEAQHVVGVAANIIAIYLSHGMGYGRYLETIGAGKWAIILPALEAHYGEVMQMVKDVLK